MTTKERGEMPNRLHTDKPFYGCVDKNGSWFDSSERFDIAVHWCYCAHGSGQDLTLEQELEWMHTDGVKLGLSIVHSDMLRLMWMAGLIN